MPFADRRVAPRRVRTDRGCGRRGSDARLPARGTGLDRDVARLSRACRARDRVQCARLFALRLRKVRPACRTENGPVHARRGAGRPSGAPRPARCRPADPDRAQRRGLDRTDSCRRRCAAGRGRRHAGRSRDRRGCLGREHRRRADRLRDDRPPNATGALPCRCRFGVLGLEPHLARPRFPDLEHRGVRCRALRVPCSRCRAWTTNTGRWSRSTASRGLRPTWSS